MSITSILTAQNLVLNGSFEQFDKCPDNYVIKNKSCLVPHWNIPTGGTPDYFNSCTLFQVGVPQNYMGYCLPKDGMAYAGFITLYDPPKDTTKIGTVNYREYLQTKFTNPLIKNQTYKVSLYFSIASYSTFATNRLGIYISKKKIRNKLTTKILHYKPQIYTDTISINTEMDTWIELSGIYTAMGGESFLTIGNFYDDKNTRFEYIENNEVSSIVKEKIQRRRIAYYYIDNVSVILYSNIHS